MTAVVSEAKAERTKQSLIAQAERAVFKTKRNTPRSKSMKLTGLTSHLTVSGDWKKRVSFLTYSFTSV